MAALEDVPSFEPNLATLRHAKLHTLEDMPEAVRQMWLDSCNSVPLLLKAGPCWRSPAPSFETIFTATSRLSKKGMSEIGCHCKAPKTPIRFDSSIIGESRVAQVQ
jgi:hypothetical protein